MSDQQGIEEVPVTNGEQLPPVSESPEAPSLAAEASPSPDVPPAPEKESSTGVPVHQSAIHSWFLEVARRLSSQLPEEVTAELEKLLKKL